MDNAPRPYINPRTRLVYLLRPDNLKDPGYAQCVPAPWDCICLVHSQGRSTACLCDKRPAVPPEGRQAEALASLQERLAGLNLAREREGLPQLKLVESKKGS